MGWPRVEVSSKGRCLCVFLKEDGSTDGSNVIHKNYVQGKETATALSSKGLLAELQSKSR